MMFPSTSGILTRLVLLLIAARAPASGLVPESANFSLPVQIAALKATVRISNFGSGGSGARSYGSGTMVGRDSGSVYILTASHVVDPGDRLGIDIYWRDGRQGRTLPTRKEVAARARQPDLAIVRLWTSDPMPALLPIAPAVGSFESRLQAGRAPSLSVGCDHGEIPYCWTAWSIGREPRTTDYSRSTFTITDREPLGGRSGGPLVSPEGYVVGVCIAGGGGQGMFATLEQIHRLCDDAGLSDLYRPTPKGGPDQPVEPPPPIPPMGPSILLPPTLPWGAAPAPGGT